MPTVRHPKTLEAVAGQPAARVTLEGESFEVADDGSVTVATERQVKLLAEAHGVDPAELRDGAETCEVVKSDGDVCGRELPCPYHSED